MCSNLYEFYRSRCDRHAHCILFDNTITYGEAFTLAASRASFLQENGYGKGDVVGLLAGSSAEWCITYMAITMMGAIVLPLDVNLPADDYPAMFAGVETKAVFVSEEYVHKVQNLPVYGVSLSESMGDPESLTVPPVEEEHLASLVYTSGTTGKPKIVALTHRNIFRTAISTSEYLELGPGDVNLCILPLFHVYALDANFIGPFAAGGALVFQPSLKGPDIMQSLKENPITIFPAAPQLWELFMDGIINRVRSESMMKYRVFMFFLKAAPVLKALGLSFIARKIFEPVHDIFGHSHRFFISGGAPLKKKYAVYYRNMGFTLIEGYGLTETTGPITLPHPRKNVLGSVGKPTPGNHVKIKNLNQDGIGQVWLGGDSVMKGYYMNDEANSQSFDEEGLFHTGDLGWLDKNDNLFLTGRSRNVIVLDSGKNVYPEELESYYKTSDIISEIAVFGRRVKGSETVYAVIVPETKSENSYQLVRDEVARLNRGLPGYKTIQQFAVSFDHLPVNTTRKVLYREVVKNLDKGLYQESAGDDVILQDELTGETQREEIIIQELKRLLGADMLYARQTLADFNMDSLKLVDLIVQLEEALGIEIDSNRVTNLHTLEDVVQYLASCEASSGRSLEERIIGGDVQVKPKKIYSPLHHVFIWFIRQLTRLFWNVHTVHPERMEFENSIIVANHQSYLDMVWIGTQIPRKYRKNINVTGKKQLYFLKFLFPIFPIIFVDRENSLPALKAGADILRLGKSLIIFPEGTRSRTGELGEFKTGAAYLAWHLDKTIVPITVNGTYEIFPPHRKLPEFFSGKKGYIVVGEHVHPSRFGSVEELNEEIRKVIASNLE